MNKILKDPWFLWRAIIYVWFYFWFFVIDYFISQFKWCIGESKTWFTVSLFSQIYSCLYLKHNRVSGYPQPSVAGLRIDLFTKWFNGIFSIINWELNMRRFDCYFLMFVSADFEFGVHPVLCNEMLGHRMLVTIMLLPFFNGGTIVDFYSTVWFYLTWSLN